MPPVQNSLPKVLSPSFNPVDRPPLSPLFARPGGEVGKAGTEKWQQQRGFNGSRSAPLVPPAQPDHGRLPRRLRGRRLRPAAELQQLVPAGLSEGACSGDGASRGLRAARGKVPGHDRQTDIVSSRATGVAGSPLAHQGMCLLTCKNCARCYLRLGQKPQLHVVLSACISRGTGICLSVCLPKPGGLSKQGAPLWVDIQAGRPAICSGQRGVIPAWGVQLGMVEAGR
jgi:hypothetical protein